MLRMEDLKPSVEPDLMKQPRYLKLQQILFALRNHRKNDPLNAKPSVSRSYALS